MIRKYEEKDIDELLDAWYSASQVAHPFLSEHFLDQERKNIRELHIPNVETWVYEIDNCGFKKVSEHLHEETGFMQLRLKLTY